MSDIKTKVDVRTLPAEQKTGVIYTDVNVCNQQSAITDNKIAVFWRSGCGPSSAAKNTLSEEYYPGVSREYVQ